MLNGFRPISNMSGISCAMGIFSSLHLSHRTPIVMDFKKFSIIYVRPIFYRKTGPNANETDTNKMKYTWPTQPIFH